jgi:hypothetical protein
MVLISHVDDGQWVKLWMDGYMPAAQRLPSLEARLWPVGTPQYALGEPCNAQERFFNMFHRRLIDYAREARASWQGDVTFPPDIDLYLLDRADWETSRIPLAVWHELDAERSNPGYRQLIVTYSGDLYRAEDDMPTMLDALEFRLRPPESFQDYPRFEAGVTYIIDRLGEPYWYPQRAVVSRLRELGLSTVHYAGLYDV